LSIPEPEFLDRLHEESVDEEAAKKMYDNLWLLLIDSRARYFKDEQAKAGFRMPKKSEAEIAEGRIKMEALK
jgi:hypothetical protein